MNFLHWFSLTENAAEHGYRIDHLLTFIHLFMAVLFIGWSLFFCYVLWRFRAKRNPRAAYEGMRSHFSTHVEMTVILIEVLLLLGFAFPIWTQYVNRFPTPETAVRVRVVGEQYLWNYQYPGTDKKFGRRSLDLVNANNPLGLDRTDEDAKDDILAKGEMHLPVDQPVILEISSKDVIHNFAIPHLRTAQDAIPGQVIPVWFKPIRAGTYDAICGQLCGSGHYAMRGVVVVEKPEEYQAWLQEQGSLSGAVQKATAPAAATNAVPVKAG